MNREWSEIKAEAEMIMKARRYEELDAVFRQFYYLRRAEAIKELVEAGHVFERRPDAGS